MHFGPANEKEKKKERKQPVFQQHYSLTKPTHDRLEPYNYLKQMIFPITPLSTHSSHISSRIDSKGL